MVLLNMVYLFVRLQITERKQELAKLEAIDCGKPLEEAAWDIVLKNMTHYLLLVPFFLYTNFSWNISYL